MDNHNHQLYRSQSGNNQTPGLSIFLSPGEWIISAVNSAYFTDRHEGQTMTHLPRFD
jgi:hypothetical protein